MKLITQPLAKKEIKKIEKEYGNYIKVTVDLENNILVAGCELHADGEKILLERKGKSENIWGGGVNLKLKEVDVIAVLNLRPNLANSSMEILDPEKRELFIKIVKNIFQELWL